ncbi:UDP-N-acetylmuramoyl-L-alanyl-D-glutamate--2,6-diaminopimelate ligase [Thermoactinomyces mirandus]|uniref:UDP-N-acetylmuramoyl-L-alanyl-D-glutamate--2,6-diaminopimelate ligase n=1 Tax=Thermoactinomyces mirandus TaxID=2756294 RepID=A0A7W1XQ90_9BACL|nr:UDP-N-acetylmuramoyl-L-alanyl-D-glutamate--2,6-diaminopimelate ligase [Thermoactinomyces mirandus]MBA4601166.1 UDP-N-acetylmuramoyl-L-alanyl-D-glutamate--2,6-diaminopimelate ligase [Thermoactinomyces mirandus]
MQVRELIQPLLLHKATGDLTTEIKGIQLDSRQVQRGDLFIALRGTKVDAHRFVEQAVAGGAAAVMVEESVALPEVPVIQVPDTRRAMAVVAAKFYGYPTKELKLIGVTGTNGKTTTTYLIEQLLRHKGVSTGVIGTIQTKIRGKTLPAKNTTPEAVELQKTFRMMRDEGCEYSVIEVSSHALDMGRTRGCQFHIGVFTNLTQDHLDYHGTMEKYREAKSLLFSQLGNAYSGQLENNPVAIFNADDEASRYFMNRTAAQVLTYGIDQPADVRAENIRFFSSGTSFTLKTYRGEVPVRLKLVGKFNVYNVLAAVSVALVEGMDLQQIRSGLSGIKGVTGRFEPVDLGQSFSVLVDYAHTPDSLENVLATIREFARGRVLCLVGCGGDRDRSKRPIMADIAVKYSDYAIFTSDNPRTEDPIAILDDMLTGVQSCPKERYAVISDRRQAIHEAVRKAEPEDVILIAGKGHETYQEINGVRHHFDDREVARDAIVSRLAK